MNIPVTDLHCDLLSYLQDAPNGSALNKTEIGCSIPDLEEGNVKLQVMAIYTGTEKGSSCLGLKQSMFFKEILTKYDNRVSIFSNPETDLKQTNTIGIIAAIENASGFCEENETIETGFKNLENIIKNTGRILYITMTHHGENRFGGGNSTKLGLKKDGEALLEYISDKKIAIDLSHTSDVLAFDILNYIAKKNLRISVIASHSNFREVFSHARNLPKEIAQEIIHRNGLIGLNFLRAFLHDTNPNALYEHINYGIDLGGEKAICFGADYFYTASHPDQSRKPFFHKEQDNASLYPSILNELSQRVSPITLEGIANKNLTNFIKRLWQ